MTTPTPLPHEDEARQRAAHRMWQAIDEQGIKGRLYRQDCDYLAGTIVDLLATHERDAQVHRWHHDRAAYFSTLFDVADAGNYRADWDAAVARWKAAEQNAGAERGWAIGYGDGFSDRANPNTPPARNPFQDDKTASTTGASASAPDSLMQGCIDLRDEVRGDPMAHDHPLGSEGTDCLGCVVTARLNGIIEEHSHA